MVMNTKKLGSAGFSITTIGLGAWAIGGGGWQFGWGPQDDQASIATIRRAVDLGINWVDTAAVYGLGHSEEVVARALAEIPAGKRPLIFTKCSLVWDERGAVSHNLQPASLRTELEDSLRRLKIDVIDLYQIHWATWRPDSAPGIEEAWQTLAELQRAGKVRCLGVSNFTVPQMERIRPIAPITSLQPPYSMLKREIEADILPYCERHGIGVIVYSPMQSGLLSGRMTRQRVAALPSDDWRRNSPEFQEPRLSRNLQVVEVLRAIGAAHGRSPAEVAIAWTLRLPAVTAAIVGARAPAQVEEFIGAGELRLSESELARIEAALG
jgi:aryl-alcohol dehydrogenase-like predicted oxidoreductase